jgi:hypothetical protein
MKNIPATLFFLTILATWNIFAADVVPTDVQQPGTQPMEIGNLESPNKCDNCHGGYNSAVEPSHNWSGSMMSHAGRDPIFWATLAIAEQDFDGAGDLCLRCHSTAGWLAGRSTPTDGSGLAAGDADGVDCDYCHKLTNPDDTEHQGVMNAPFLANETGEDSETDAYYGSGMSSMWGGSDKLGPYNNPAARHQFMQSEFHRDRNFCGTCHDVSNPVVGDLAHNHGALFNPGSVVADGTPGAPVDGKAAFNNLPYLYGTTERTFSEFRSGDISNTLVDDYGTLPGELQAGVLQQVYNAAYDPGSGSANYQNPPAPRYYSCQSCHMRPVTGKGANKNGVPTRVDLPLHDLTGGNYWMADAIEYLDQHGKLRLGGGMSAYQIQAMQDGALRAREQLQLAASLVVIDDTVKVINHTGHKLITGYPEGRRMWLNIKWFDVDGVLIDEIGEYGPVTVEIDGVPGSVNSIVLLSTPDTVIYEAHMGMTQEWAQQLKDLGVSPTMPLKFDRLDGTVVHTLADLAAMPAGSTLPTFHFALNNIVISDNRIPPYRMNAAEAQRRNAPPIPTDRYLVDGEGNYPYYDLVPLYPPGGAAAATIELLYQPTSWEYIEFLYLANNGTSAFLGTEGANMLEAWLNTEMAEPVVMASASWGDTPPDPVCDLDTPILNSATAGQGEVVLDWEGPVSGGYDGFSLYYDQADKAQKVADLDCTDVNIDCDDYTDSGLTNGNEYCYKVTATSTEPPCESGFSNILCATPQPHGETEYASLTIDRTGRWVKIGNGKNATWEFVETSTFAPGDRIAVQMTVLDVYGSPVPSATATLTATGPETTVFTATSSDGDGQSEGEWSTQAPNKKGNGGTPTGVYSISVSGLDSSTHEWDGSSASVNIEIVNSSAMLACGKHAKGCKGGRPEKGL